MSSHRSLTYRSAAVALPFALVMGAAGTAFAAKPPRTPVPTFTGKPAAVTNLTTGTFAWNVAANTTYTCSKDGAVATVCTSPKTYSALTNATHSFVLKAKLTTPSNAKGSAASYSWKVDTVAPTAPTVAPIAGPTSNTNASVSFSDADATVTGFTCALDGAVVEACTSPRTYSLLTNAPHTVVVTAHDAAGNTATSSVQWVVDALAPNIPDVVPPASPTKSTAASVSFTSAGATSFTCALDGGPAGACTSPWTATVVEGSHTLVVTATDLASNVSTGSASWVVDVTAPFVPVLITAPASNTSLTDGQVLFSDTDLSAVQFSCVLDAAPAAPCTSPFTAPSVLGTGLHTFAVTALDAAGNESAPLTASWTVDTTSFPAQFVTGPDSPTNDTSPTFDFLATDTTSTGFLCSIDYGQYAACTAPKTLAVATQGLHSLSVESLDNAVPANASVSVTWSWILDTTGPSSAPSAGSGVPANSGPVSTTPTFTFTTTDPNAVGFVCSLDGGPFVPCASGYQPPVGDGSHTLVVGTVDQAGNVSTQTLTYTWILDTTRPAAKPVALSSLINPVKVGFSEVVQGVTASTVGLRQYGGKALAAKVSCLTASGAATSCAGALVRAALVTPTVRLVPGQKYSVTLGAVHDAAGNLGLLTPLTFRALRTIQDNNGAMAQAWTTHAAYAAYGSRYQVADLAGAAASYRFTGTSITWYTARGPAMGSVRVYVDGKLKTTVSNASTVNSWHVARTVSGLTNATHTLTLVDAGKRLVVDAVKVGTKALITNPLISTRLAPVVTSYASAGRYAVADQAGDAVAMTFRGTSISWYTVTGTTMGKAKVYVDGVLKGTYDNYASATHYNVRRTWSFTDKVHTVKIVVLGTHRTGAKGSRVAVDRLVVG